MASVTLKGNPVSIKGEIPAAGVTAPDFSFVRPDLSEGTLYGLQAKAKVLIAVPSLDTGICAIETRKFNQELAGIEGVQALVISKDLPFAMGRFCAVEGIQNVTAASDFRQSEFIEQYNTAITSGGMKGLSARAVFVVDEQNVIRYSELVPEIAQEPQYDAALAVVKSLAQ